MKPKIIKVHASELIGPKQGRMDRIVEACAWLQQNPGHDYVLGASAKSLNSGICLIRLTDDNARTLDDICPSPEGFIIKSADAKAGSLASDVRTGKKVVLHEIDKNNTYLFISRILLEEFGYKPPEECEIYDIKQVIFKKAGEKKRPVKKAKVIAADDDQPAYVHTPVDQDALRHVLNAAIQPTQIVFLNAPSGDLCADDMYDAPAPG